jgi:hypothetical protein
MPLEHTEVFAAIQALHNINEGFEHEIERGSRGLEDAWGIPLTENELHQTKCRYAVINHCLKSLERLS